MSQNEHGEEAVTTSVTVSCSSLGGPFKTRENGTTTESKQNSQKESKDDDKLEEQMEKPRKVSSSQVLIGAKENSISVDLSNYDSDDTLSGEESVTNLDLLEMEEYEGRKEKDPAQNEGMNAPATAGESTAISITVKEDRTGNNAATSNTSSKVTLPQATRRKSSNTPFIEKKGFLYKMGGHRKSWKLRFFVLRPGVFQYFKDSRCHKMLGVVKLKNLSIFFPGAGERKQSFQFTVHTESSWNRRPDYVIAAQSENEMKEWIAAFKMAGQVDLSGLAESGLAESDEDVQ